MVNNASRQLLTKIVGWAGQIMSLVITVFGGTMLIGIVVLADCILWWWKGLLASVHDDETSNEKT